MVLQLASKPVLDLTIMVVVVVVSAMRNPGSVVQLVPLLLGALGIMTRATRVVAQPHGETAANVLTITITKEVTTITVVRTRTTPVLRHLRLAPLLGINLAPGSLVIPVTLAMLATAQHLAWVPLQVFLLHRVWEVHLLVYREISMR